MKGAEVLVQMLLEYKVEAIFGVPGDTSLPLYEAIYDAAPKVRHILARDERSATFMADAYARISFKPGICECHSGAGALYSVPGVAEANASSIPVILFTSDISLADEGRGAITALDHHKLFEPIAKWSSFLKLTEKIPETVRRAFRVATTGRPGAVHLALPKAAMPISMFGYGCALTTDFIIQGAPGITAKAANIAVGDVMWKSLPMLIVFGAIALPLAFRSVMRDVRANAGKPIEWAPFEISAEEKAEREKWLNAAPGFKKLALPVIVILFALDIVGMLVFKLRGGGRYRPSRRDSGGGHG